MTSPTAPRARVKERPPLPPADAALHEAIERGDRAAAVAALDAGASVAPIGDRAPPLHEACFHAPELVPLLLERGADPNASRGSTTALGYLFLPQAWEDERSEDAMCDAIRALAKAGARLDAPLRDNGAPAFG